LDVPAKAKEATGRGAAADLGGDWPWPKS